MKQTKLWRYGVKHRDGTYKHAEGETLEEAAAFLGWPMKDINLDRSMATRNRDKGKGGRTRKPMTEETRAHLRENKKKKKEQKALRGA